MPFSDLTDPRAVDAAMDELDQIGRDAFPEKYGFRRATGHLVERHGQRYDSKAIVGASHGYRFPERGPLRHEEFSGGAATVRRKLEQLGFRMFRIDDPAEGAAEPLDAILQQTLAAVRRLLADDADDLIVRGRSRTGIMADVPWVAIIPETWQGSAQRGYYLV